MDLSTLFEFCSFTVARQLSQKRKRRGGQLRRLTIQELEGRQLLTADPMTTYNDAIAAADAAYQAVVGPAAQTDAGLPTASPPPQA